MKHGTILPLRVIDAGDGIGLRRAETHRDDEGDGGYRGAMSAISTLET